MTKMQFLLPISMYIAMSIPAAFSQVLPKEAQVDPEWTHITYTIVAKENPSWEFQVSVDYILGAPHYPKGCYKCSIVTRATPLWFNLSGPALTEKSTVFLIITNSAPHPYDGPEDKISYVLNLNRQKEGHFSGEFSQSRIKLNDTTVPLRSKALDVYSSGYPGTYVYHQEIGIEVDLDGDPTTLDDRSWLTEAFLSLHEQRLL